MTTGKRELMKFLLRRLFAEFISRSLSRLVLDIRSGLNQFRPTCLTTVTHSAERCVYAYFEDVQTPVRRPKASR